MRRFLLVGGLVLLGWSWVAGPPSLSAEMRFDYLRAISEDYARQKVRHPTHRSVVLVLRDRNLPPVGESYVCLVYRKYNLQGPPKSRGFVSGRLEVLRQGTATTLIDVERVAVRNDEMSECRWIVEPLSAGDVLFGSFEFSGMARVKARETPQVSIRIFAPAARGATAESGAAEAMAPREIPPRLMDTYYVQEATARTKHPQSARISLVVTDDRFIDPEGQRLCTYYARYTADRRKPNRGVVVFHLTRERAGEEPVDLIPPTRVPVEREAALLNCPELNLDLQAGDVVHGKYRLKKMPRLRAGEQVAIQLQLTR